MSAPPPAGALRPRAWRLRPGCLAILDLVAAAACAALVFGILFRTSPHALHVAGLVPRLSLPPLLALCLAVPVAVRRRAPLPALVVALVASLAVLLLGGEVTPGPVIPLALVVYMVAATQPRNLAVGGLAGTVALMTLQGLVLSLRGIGAGNAIAGSFLLVVCWLIGFGVQQRRAYAVHLREQAASAAVTEERLRIARELHDVVAHSMTVVAVQAGFGEYVFDSHPGQARAALAAIQTVTRDALTDMQRLLGVLRQAAPAVPGTALDFRTGAGTGETADDQGTGTGPGGEGGEPAAGAAAPPVAGAAPPLAPAPGLADLDRLAAATEGAGVEVNIRRTGQVRQIPPGIDLSAFRIVQEALTNVVKHSGALACLVAVDYGELALSVEITDPGPPPVPALGRATPGAGPAPGTGHGLIGMAERVSLCGGQFSAGPLPGGGFGVRAHLPLPAEVTTTLPGRQS